MFANSHEQVPLGLLGATKCTAVLSTQRNVEGLSGHVNGPAVHVCQANSAKYRNHVTC